MKKVLPLFLLSLFFLSCLPESSSSKFLKTTSLSKSNYGIMISNYLDKTITIKADLYDEYDNLLENITVGTAFPNHTEIFRYDVNIKSELADQTRNAYIRFEAFLGDTLMEIEKNDSVLFTDLKNNYTRCHFSNNSQYITHNVIQNPESQKSTSTVYDDTNNYVEFKLYDDLSWLKGTWAMTEGYGNDTLKFEAGTPFARIDEYNKGEYSNSGFVLEWISLNNFSDSFYVNTSKNEIKIVHPNALFPDILLVSIYKKVE